jgi:hypothetical protein
MAVGNEAGTTDHLGAPLGTFEYEKGSSKNSNNQRHKQLLGGSIFHRFLPPP